MSIRIYGNRALRTLPGEATRPTPSRVRAALFNIWQTRVRGAHWLDLCSGSGAMAAEALCRGAARVIATEQSTPAARLVESNCRPLVGEAQQFELRKGDIRRSLAGLQGQPFDLVYFDPPYDSDLYAAVLPLLIQLELLSPDAEICCEQRSSRTLDPVAGLECYRIKAYGSTSLSFWRPQPLVPGT